MPANSLTICSDWRSFFLICLKQWRVAQNVSLRRIDVAASATTTPENQMNLLPELEKLLGEHLATNVSVTATNGRGRVVIEFADLNDLERIYRAMTEGPAV